MRRWVFWGERVLASPWRWAVVALGLVFALCGAAAAWPEAGGPSWSGLAVGVVVVLLGLVVASTGLLARVHLHADRLVHRDPFRRRTVPLDDVVAVGVETVDDKLVWQVSAPVLRLRGGEEVALMGLAGISYGAWRTPLLQRNVTALLEWWGADLDEGLLEEAEPVDAALAAEVAAAVRAQPVAPPPPRRPAAPPPGDDLEGPFRRG